MTDVNVVRVGQISQQIRGVTYSSSETTASPIEGHLPVLRANNITEYGIDLDDLVFVPEYRVAARQLLKIGDVVIVASSGSLSVVGRAAIVDSTFRASFGAFCKVLRPSSLVDPSYFAHFFLTANYRRRISFAAAGLNINNIRNEDLDELEIPLPPLAEQRRIAEILDQADDLRRKRRVALEKLNTLPQAIFQEMFGNPIANPRSLKTVSLRALGRVVTGGTPSTKTHGLFGGNIPFVTPGDLLSQRAVRRTVSEAGAAAVGTVRRGSSLVCCIGATIGKMDLAREVCAFNQQINAVEWSSEIDDLFGYYALTFLLKSIATAGASTTLPILKKSRFEQITIPVPPINEQETFHERAAKVSGLANQMRAQLLELDQLFASLQNRAFEDKLRRSTSAKAAAV